MKWFTDKRFRLLYVPENQSGMRELMVSRNRLTLFLAALVSFLFISMSILGFLFSNYSGDERLAELNAENRILKDQLSDIGGRMKVIDEQLKLIRTKDSELRVIADLPDINMLLKDAGIGGSDLEIDYNPDLLSDDADALVRKNLENLEKLESNIKLELQSYAELHENISANAAKLVYLPSINPIKRGRITDRFGVRKSFRSFIPHTGLDIAARWGTPVYVTADGVVEGVTWRGGYGKSIIVDHGNGIKTLYGHLSSYKVKNGERVKRNQKIAEVGSTGLSTGPHLHYEVRINNVPQNPELFIFFDMVDYLEMQW
ncbi:MAG TPA: M23 family metallopeptidase [bacterium]|nr:M23 family metallopeptidase [bacterium]